MIQPIKRKQSGFQLARIHMNRRFIYIILVLGWDQTAISLIHPSGSGEQRGVETLISLPEIHFGEIACIHRSAVVSYGIHHFPENSLKPLPTNSMWQKNSGKEAKGALSSKVAVWPLLLSGVRVPFENGSPRRISEPG
jgi:hypothetical protein